MKITLTNKIEAQTDQLLAGKFTFKNPKYYEALRFGRSTRKIDRYIELFDKTDTGLDLPIGALAYLLKHYEPEVIDNRKTNTVEYRPSNTH